MYVENLSHFINIVSNKYPIKRKTKILLYFETEVIDDVYTLCLRHKSLVFNSVIHLYLPYIYIDGKNSIADAYNMIFKVLDFYTEQNFKKVVMVINYKKDEILLYLRTNEMIHSHSCRNILDGHPKRYIKPDLIDYKLYLNQCPMPDPYNIYIYY